MSRRPTKSRKSTTNSYKRTVGGIVAIGKKATKKKTARTVVAKARKYTDEELHVMFVAEQMAIESMHSRPIAARITPIALARYCLAVAREIRGVEHEANNVGRKNVLRRVGKAGQRAPS